MWSRARAEHRSEYDGEGEAASGGGEHRPEHPQAVRRVCRVCEKVAGDEDARDEDDTEREPVRRHHRERPGRGAAPVQVACAVDQSSPEGMQRPPGGLGVGAGVRTKQVAIHGGCERGGGGEDERGDGEDRGVPASARREDEAHREAGRGAGDRGGRPEAWRYGVGRQQQPAADDSRQRGRQRREQEAVDREVDQRQHVDRGAEAIRQQDEGDGERDHHPYEVADEQHLTASPAIQEHTGPRADHGEREQQDREGLGNAGGRARTLRGEEEEGR